MSRTEPTLEWTRRSVRADHLIALRTMKIGPLFPADPDHRPGLGGTRRENRLGKDTKPPYTSRKRTAKSPVTARCLTCKWTADGTSWRPVRRSLAEHVAKKHRTLARSVA